MNVLNIREQSIVRKRQYLTNIGYTSSLISIPPQEDYFLIDVVPSLYKQNVVFLSKDFFKQETNEEEYWWRPHYSLDELWREKQLKTSPKEVCLLTFNTISCFTIVESERKGCVNVYFGDKETLRLLEEMDQIIEILKDVIQGKEFNRINDEKWKLYKESVSIVNIIHYGESLSFDVHDIFRFIQDFNIAFGK